MLRSAVCNQLGRSTALGILFVCLVSAAGAQRARGGDWYFPPPGEGLDSQDRRRPEEVGLKPGTLQSLKGRASRWALWRHGYLVHVEGDWNESQDVASLRKTWHALTVGAAIRGGRIPSTSQKVRVWERDLRGKDAEASWWHLMTQSTGFDFPHTAHRDIGDPRPGQVWTYSDKNARRLCSALAKAYGKESYRDGYDDVVKAAYFDAIGMRGWSARAIHDGIRFHLDLEDMGRLGLLVLARGRWKDEQLVPQWFVRELETRQTAGMRPVYNGPDDGNVGGGWFHEHRDRFPECPYGYMTWVNTSADYYPGAGRDWAFAAGAGGTYVLWNYRHGIVFAGVGVDTRPTTQGIPHVIEAGISGPNPLGPAAVGRWDRFETSIANDRRYGDPYQGVTLDVTYSRPDGKEVHFWGFHDGGHAWKIRFMPDRIGTWQYRARFSDGSKELAGAFECVPSDLRGMVTADETNPTWVGFKGGGHVLVRGFHVGDRFFASNWPEGKRKEFLDWAHRQGYNLLSIASHYLNRDADGRGRGWNTPRLWPLDASEYRKAERILDDLAEREIMVFPFAGFFGQRSGYPTARSEQELYVRYALARFGPYWNLLFNVAGPEPNLRRSWMSNEDVARLGTTISELDVFGHLLSVHNRTGDDPYRDSTWTTYGTLQGPKTTDRKQLSKGLLASHHSRKPLFAQETLWSGNQHHPHYTDADLRKNAYVIQMSAAALCFGDMNGNSSSGFSGSMELEERRQRRHDIVKEVWDFIETVPFYRMKPRQDLVDNGFCLADVGREYLIYLESPGTVSVAVEGEPYRVEWIDARESSARRSSGTTANGKGLASPRDGGDWILHLVRLSE